MAKRIPRIWCSVVQRRRELVIECTSESEPSAAEAGFAGITLRHDVKRPPDGRSMLRHYKEKPEDAALKGQRYIYFPGKSSLRLLAGLKPGHYKEGAG